MKFKVGLLLSLIVTVITVNLIPLPSAQATTQDQINKATQERNDLEKKLNATKNQSKSLSDQITYMDNQIRLNELEIQDTQGQIQSNQSLLAQTNAQISDVNKKLDNLAKVMAQTKAAAEARIRESYKQSRTSTIASLLTSANFQTMMRTFEYLKRIEEEDRKVLADMAQTKKDYDSQKADLEKLKASKEQIKSQLLAQQSQVESKQDELEDNKSARSQLLAETKQDESRYSTLLAQKEAELRAYASAVAAPGQQRFYVLRGQVIAYQGNTGCSTGSHLHFGYRKANLGTYLGGWTNAISSGQWIDPVPYINNGTLADPLPEPYSITQRFGANEAGIVDYGPQGHPAVDLSKYYGAPIFAADSGWAQRMTDSGCGTGPGKGIIITHANGSQTLYWHIQ